MDFVISVLLIIILGSFYAYAVVECLEYFIGDNSDE